VISPDDSKPSGSCSIAKPPAVTRPGIPGDMPEGTLRVILKQAGVEPDLFLQKK
jgi:hypothetical protein